MYMLKKHVQTAYLIDIHIEQRRATTLENPCKYTKRKEKVIKDLLSVNGLAPTSHDQVPFDTTLYGRERPDFLFDVGTHVVILEVDENQHKDRQCLCSLAAVQPGPLPSAQWSIVDAVRRSTPCPSLGLAAAVDADGASVVVGSRVLMLQWM